MKKYLVAATLIVIAFLAGIWATIQITNQRPRPVVVPDPVLRTALQLATNSQLLPSTGNEWTDAVNATKLPLYKEGLAALATLEIEDVAITSTEGLQLCVNLESLTLRNCGLTDISFLAHMPHLSTIDLTGNQITDLSPLRGFTNVRFLRLSNNQIADLSPLSGLQNVYEFGLSQNRIADIAPLKNLRCAALYLDQNEITQIPPLTNMGLDKLVISNNSLDEESCELLTGYRAIELIEVIHTDCGGVSVFTPDGPSDEPDPDPAQKSQTVYSDGEKYHLEKTCGDTSGRAMAGMLREDRAIEKGLGFCETCAKRPAP